MLKDIRMHLANDELIQEQLEQQLSEKIRNIHSQNATAFAQYIPSMLPDVQNVSTQNISVFSNKNGQLNIVDYGAGRTLYGPEPKSEIDAQVSIITHHCPYISLESKSSLSSRNIAASSQHALSQLESYQYYLQCRPLPDSVNVLIVFGLGLGYHIQTLVERYQIKHLVIYEPERQYFQCSALATNWQNILKTMEAKGTAVYFQIEKDGRDLVNNIEELAEHYSVDGFYFYKHYNHPVFDAIDGSLKTKTWSSLKQEGFNFNHAIDPNLYLPIWTQGIELEKYHSVNDENELFNNNLSAFKKYFPDIYKEFENYQPTHWLPVSGENGEINLIQKTSLISFCGPSPKLEAQANFEHFTQYPNKDGLVLGYTGTKLKKYLHYQFVEQTEQLLKDIDADAGDLPETVKSLIMFGIGIGYQLEALFENKQVEKLFLCEPNRDFFYASLFAIDWNAILKKADESESRIYINIGDDGSHLFRDLLSQFYSIGPYILANTYFYQGYYNANLVQAIAQLREQLQIVISMGEYYDHARYGIAHTTETINRGYPLLEKEPQKKLTKQQKEVPVFIVGNGPSLDYAIEEIQTWQGQAIVVSCGTALMPLYKNGIVPDFHAEIEQNRSTFDWICRVGDFDYLKQISLISCNGIHPDTCELFKDVYIAFKEGESSTISALNILGRENYEELKFAFPTVSNFATNIFSKIGFNQLYLFGVDLGFADQEKHHSKQSGYYNESGKEVYDYREKNNTSITVPGNFRKTVFTKHEFKVSKAILEQTLTSRKVDCFNTSDGARIVGSTPLTIDNILLVNSSEAKQDVLKIVKSVVFKPAHEFDHYKETFNAKYQQKHLEFELNGLIELVKQPINTSADIEGLINKQKEMLFASYTHAKSLLFFLLYGTVNYANSVLSKMSDASCKTLHEIQRHWLSFLEEVSLHSDFEFDFASSFRAEREKHIRAKLELDANIDFLTEIHQEKFKYYYLKDYPSEKIDKGIFNQDELVIFSENFNHISFYKKVERDVQNRLSKSKEPISLFMGGCCSFNPAGFYLDIKDARLNVSYYYCPTLDLTVDIADNSVAQGQLPFTPYVYHARFMGIFRKSMSNVLVFIPKLHFVEGDSNAREAYLTEICSDLEWVTSFVEFESYIAIPKPGVRLNDIVTDSNGNRGRIRHQLKPMYLQGLLMKQKTYQAFTDRFKNELKINSNV